MKFYKIILTLCLLILMMSFQENNLNELVTYNDEGLELKIKTKKKVLSLSQNEYPEVNVSIYNHSKEEKIIIQPGDGSEVGWRIPTVRWSIIKKENNLMHPDTMPALRKGYERCGNMNSFKKEEVEVLSPKTSVTLNEWTPFPEIPREIGTYSIKFYYKFEPNHRWVLAYVGKEMGMEEIKNETEEYLLVSNEIVFKVIK